MSLDYVLIGRRIHDIRKLLHMTQSELAEAVDLYPCQHRGTEHRSTRSSTVRTRC